MAKLGIGLVSLFIIVIAIGLVVVLIQPTLPPEPPNNPLLQFPSPNENPPVPPSQVISVTPVPSFDLSDANDGAIPDFDLEQLELLVQNSVNRERVNSGLPPLKWNPDLAAIARRHTNDLAAENVELTDFFLIFPDPYISHEGFTFGFHHVDRLNANDIYYFSASAENILAHPFSKNKTYTANELAVEPPRIQLPLGVADEKPVQTLTRLRDFLEQKHERILTVPKADWKTVDWETAGQAAEGSVDQWMNSPGHRQNILTPDFDEAGVGIAKVNDYLIMTQVFIKRSSCGFQKGPCCQQEGYYPYCFVPFECKNNWCQNAG